MDENVAVCAFVLMNVPFRFTVNECRGVKECQVPSQSQLEDNKYTNVLSVEEQNKINKNIFGKKLLLCSGEVISPTRQQIRTVE